MAATTRGSGRALANACGIGAVAALVVGFGCARTPVDAHRLPTGVLLDPAGHSIALGSMPLAMAFSPDSTHLVVLLCGYREQGVQVVDLATGRVTQTLSQPAAFIGLAFSPDGRTLYTSGGNQDLVYRYSWRANTAVLVDSLRLAPDLAIGHGKRYPAGLAVSRDGRRLFVAENLADSLAVIDVASARILQRVATGRYPYDVVVGPDERVYVSAWGGDAIATFTPRDGGLASGPRIAVGRHPSALALNRGGTRLFAARASFDRIAVVDTHRDVVIAELRDTPAGAPPEGATPDGLALSPDGGSLYAAEADHNAVAIFALTAATAGTSEGSVADTLMGRIPVEWYPTAVLARAGMLHVLNGKGRGAGPNPTLRQPGTHGKRDPLTYTLGQTSGSLTTLTLPSRSALAALSTRVARAEGWNMARTTPSYPPFTHVIYVIKENRTYDQVLGDIPGADGDTSLIFFPPDQTPNHHALADRFGVFDRFFVNAEVSGQGHNWSTAAYSPDYVEKTIPSNYSGRGRTYDYEGTNRDTLTDDDVNEPGTGYLWDAALRARVSLRNYGEFVRRDRVGHWVANKASLAPYTCAESPGWDLDIADQFRVDVWQAEFQRCVATDSLPQLTILRLPNDHTAGAKANAHTPRAMVADNDLALGRVIEALSHSRFWPSTVVFVLEDDAQDGPDHVDSHRSPLLMISAWNRPGVVHRFANTTDVIATIGRILRLEPLSQFDYYGRPIEGVFAAAPDPRPYVALRPGVSLEERNPPDSTAARAMSRLDLRREDPADQDLFNRILWAMVKGPKRPYPGTHRLALQGVMRGD
jgi:YVTN family beta-propeller protein